MKTLFLILSAASLVAQDSPNRATVPFSDPSKPRSLVVTLLKGGITVRGYEGKEVVIEAAGRSAGFRGLRGTPAPPGMHRLEGGNGGVDINEHDNTVTVNGGMMRAADYTIQVPVQTSLKLKTLNGGDIVVENITGEIEAQNMNGAIKISNVSGSVVANSMNGKVTVSLDKVTADKSMSFSSMNGEIDVTLPADLKARFKMRTDNGEIFIDDGFDVKLTTASKPEVEDQRKNGGRYRVRIDGATYGDVNGGGPEMQFITFNGKIMIHKK